MSTFRHNFAYAFRGGVFMAAFLSVLALPFEVYRLATGRGSVDNVLAMIITYWIGAPASGAVVGMLLPLAKTWWGAAVVGWVGVLPLAIAASMAVADFVLGSEEMVVALIYSALGPLVGIAVWRQVKKTSSSDPKMVDGGLH